MSEIVSPIDEAPFPPRYWWLKRIALAYAVLFVALLGLRLWWGWVAHNRLEAEIAKYKAAGEPIEPEDFNPKEEIPDEENAAKLLEKAAELLATTTVRQQWMIDEGCAHRETWEKYRQEIEAVLNDNAGVIERAHQAQQLSHVDWGLRLSRGNVGATLPVFGFSPQRAICKLLGAAALHSHFSGDDAQAIERIRDLIAQADAIAEQPYLIAHLVSSACTALALSKLERTIPTLTVDDDASNNSHGASRQEIVSLASRLLDDHRARQSFERSLFAERMYQLDSIRSIRPNTTGSIAAIWTSMGQPDWGMTVASTWIFLPALEADASFILRHTSQMVRAAGSASAPEARSIMSPFDVHEPKGVFESVHEPCRFVLLQNFDRLMGMNYKQMALKRMAGIALLLRLHELEHGHRAQELAELVPTYLAAVPSDPFTSDGTTFRYRCCDEVPVLYSIGPDGVDDGGDFIYDRSRTSWWSQRDNPFFLSRNPLDQTPGEPPELP